MKTITNARSKKNGIVFYSNIMPLFVIDAHVDKDGKIQIIILPRILSDVTDFSLDEKEHESFLFTELFLVFFFCLISIGLFGWLTVVFRNIFISIATLFACLFLYFGCKLACCITKSIHLKELSRFHAAEHMVINAYCNLQHVPTMEEIKKSSRFSKCCGSMALLNPCMMTLLLTLCFISGILLKPIFCLLVLVSTPLLILIIEKFALLRYLQILFTSKPTNLELEVALKGIQAYDDMEKHLKQGDIDFLFSKYSLEV